MNEYLEGRVLVKTGDITRETVDAVVNAANSTLMGGGGVDGAIHRVGGPDILAACKEIRKKRYPEGLPAGQAVITTGGKLPAAHVIHTVGPVWIGGSHGEPTLLGNCYWNSLRLAVDNGLKSVAFPAISTGVYRFPRELAAEVSSRTVKEFLGMEAKIERVVFVFFSEDDARVFLAHQVFDQLAKQ